MNSWWKKLKIKAILPVAAALAIAAIGTTFALGKWEFGITNELTMHTTDVKVEEEFDLENPAEKKEVWFENDGESAVFLRVTYAEAWEKPGKEGEADTLFLLPNQIDGKEVAVKHWTDSWPESENGKDSSLWMDGGDGWYYYRKVLLPKKTGETDETDKTGQTDNILTHVTFRTDLPEYESMGYKDADYHLYFKAEAVQCSDGESTINSKEVNKNATRELFGKEAEIDSDGETVIWNVPGNVPEKPAE